MMGNVSVSFDLNFWVVLFAALNFAITATVAINNRSKAAAQELKAVEETARKALQDMADKAWHRIGQHGERISKIEGDVRNAITDDDIAAVHRRVDEIAAVVSRTEGQLTEISKNLDFIKQALMRRREDYGNAG